MHHGGFTNSIEWLIQQVRVSGVHYDYLKDGRICASVTFSGESALVRQLLDRMAELSESGRPQPQVVDVLRHIHGSS